MAGPTRQSTACCYQASQLQVCSQPTCSVIAYIICTRCCFSPPRRARRTYGCPPGATYGMWPSASQLQVCSQPAYLFDDSACVLHLCMELCRPCPPRQAGRTAGCPHKAPHGLWPSANQRHSTSFTSAQASNSRTSDHSHACLYISHPCAKRQCKGCLPLACINVSADSLTHLHAWCVWTAVVFLGFKAAACCTGVADWL